MNLIKKATSAGFRKILALLSPLIRIWEDSKFLFKEESVSPPVFIVGAPRTGSTIIYQALTNAYQLGFIDNTACTWHRNLRFGLWLSQKKYGDQPHNNFKAEHGSTRNYGGHAPSECGQFWYRWLPKDRHFIDHHEVTSKMVTEIRKEVLGVSAYLKQPLLFKNLNAGQRLRLIRKAFPSAKIIFIRRDPRFVIRSILKAREKTGVAPGDWWSIMPPNVKDLLSLSECEMSAAQVYYVEKQIQQDLALFPDNRVWQLHNQELSESLMDELARWMSVERRKNGELPAFMKDDLSTIDLAEKDSLEKAINRYPFDKDAFI